MQNNIMDHHDNKIGKKENGSIAGSIFSLLIYATVKALSDKETREKIIDTYFDVKQKLSNSSGTEKRVESDEHLVKNVTSTGDQ
jgi:hypothetical protein